MIDRVHDIEGGFYIFPTKLFSGRRSPAFSGYRPNHKVHDNYLTSALHEYIGVSQVDPGETAYAKVWFITPEVYPHCLWIGREIDVQEGARVIGKLTVTKILNKVLEGSPETYNSTWVEPQALKATHS